MAPEIIERCLQCNKNVPASQSSLHTEKHAKEQRIRDTQAALAQAELDKEGITVSHAEGINFGVIEAEDSEQRREITIRGTHPTRNPDVVLLSYRMRSSTRRDTHGEK